MDFRASPTELSGPRPELQTALEVLYEFCIHFHSVKAIKIILKKLMTASMIVLVIMQVAHEKNNPADGIYLTANKSKDKKTAEERQAKYQICLKR